MIEVSNNIFWVGAIDWNIRNFHGFTYSTPKGTTYNAYLILDEKVALIDTVYGKFFGEMLDRIEEIIDPTKIDYVIANHVEIDHSGALPKIMELLPQAKVVCTQKCKDGLKKNHFKDWNWHIVKTGDTIKLGKKTLYFIEAPMIHWPDSMFTYVQEDALLLSNDAFGQHIATSFRFNDEVEEDEIIHEAIKYYANILWHLSSVILRKIEEIKKMNILIRTIAPSHGIIWRKNPEGIVELYINWAKGFGKKEKIIVVYDTMWGNTEKLAEKIVDGIISEEIETRLYRLPCSDITEIFGELLDSKGLLIGSSTIHNSFIPTLGQFLEDIKCLKPKGIRVATFGSYGWAGGAIRDIEEAIKKAGIEIITQSLEVKYVPDEIELNSAYEFGTKFAKSIKEEVKTNG